MIEGLRSLVIQGWDVQALLLGFGFTFALIAVSLGARGTAAEGADGADVRRRFDVAFALAYRQTTVLLKNPSLFVPPMLFPLMNFMAFAGGLSRLRHVPGFDFHGGYTAFQFVFVLLQSAAFGGVFAGFGIARDFERGFARRLLVSAPQRNGIIARLRDRGARALGDDRRRPDDVALVAGMQVGGSGVDLFGLYALAIIFNQIGLLWACGVAMRFRSVQAGPLMQTPVFMALFLAPVYVPLDLLRGWIHTVARLNPLTFILEAGRGFIQGEPTQVATAFGLAAALFASSPSGRGRASRAPSAPAPDQIRPNSATFSSGRSATHHLAAVRVVADGCVALDRVDPVRVRSRRRSRRGRAGRRPSRRPRYRPGRARRPRGRSRAATPRASERRRRRAGRRRRRASRGKARHPHRRRSSTRRRRRTRGRRRRRTTGRTSCDSTREATPGPRRAAALPPGLCGPVTRSWEYGNARV